MGAKSAVNKRFTAGFWLYFLDKVYKILYQNIINIMRILEIIMAFCIGLVLLIVTAIIFKSKSSVIFKLLFNAILGFIVLFIISSISFFNIAVNPVNALLVGFLGVFGIGIIYLIMFI